MPALAPEDPTRNNGYHHGGVIGHEALDLFDILILGADINKIPLHMQQSIYSRTLNSRIYE